MGIELRLNITHEDIRHLCFGEGREALLAASEHQYDQTYSQNILLNPAVIAHNAVGNLLAAYVEPQVGADKLAEVQGFLKSSDDIRRALLNAVVKGDSSGPEIEGLVNRHFSELQAVPGYFALLSKVNMDRADEPRRDLFKISLRGFALMVIEANEMYGPETRTQFLRHVTQGILNEDYERGMRVALKSMGRRISGEDVLRLFTGQREAVRQALLYETEGHEPGYDAPDLFAQPALAAHILETKAIAGYLAERGWQEHELSAAYDIVSSWRRLINQADRITERQLGQLARSHANQLSRLTDFYTRLSDIDVSGASLDCANKLRQGSDSILRVIVRAKAMYNPETSAEFLQHVKASALEQLYDLGMLATARSIVPKTL